MAKIDAQGTPFAGLALASFLPGLKIPIAASITYAAGKAIKMRCASDDALSPERTQGGARESEGIGKHGALSPIYEEENE